MRRVGLPPGGSTLTTSAPSPASVSPQYSACSSQSSMTRMPESGPRPGVTRGPSTVSRPMGPMNLSVSGSRCRLVREQLFDAVADLVDLLERRQEVHRARLLPVVHLLAVQVDLERPLPGGRKRDSRLAVVDRG